MRRKKKMKKRDHPTMAEPPHHSYGSQGQAHPNTGVNSQLFSYKEHELTSSPTLTLCYSNGGSKGFSSSMGNMTKALF
ncbi:hypothetical protein F2Q68_00026285 [Brassica cretica]|uniref:AT-hook motif nuclear-localized protein n=2 Tax=Brassica cretica TaxID=69181 RepID=A0ABQ7DS45_BRACR|nr:hypothetical protein F2Q68_00026285 [Brassica cretica]KAF3580055.1 hypothetical protein DY000_02032524 [Brassica cretica]